MLKLRNLRRNQEEDAKLSANTVRTLKTIRQLSLKRFAQLYKSPGQLDFLSLRPRRIPNCHLPSSTRPHSGEFSSSIRSAQALLRLSH